MQGVVKKVKTRFAPSPTGYLHIGNARTALFNYLFAKHHQGDFILRIEDTDRQRSSLEFENSILEDLKWLGLEWNGMICRQSERLDIYRDFAERLLKEGRAYKCWCSEERLHELRKQQIKSGIPPRYDGKCKISPALSSTSIPAIRFNVLEKTIVIEDLVHKKVVFNSKTFGDFIIMGSDGIPTYNFAVVVDDSLMGISHVIRGDDHLPNTPKQILLFEALGFRIPEYAHLSLILGKDSTPLSKRHGISSVAELRKHGFIPDAILNYLCHLGWSPKNEFLSLKEAVDVFSIEGLSRSPAIFDVKRLERFNKTYIEKGDTRWLIDNLKDYFDSPTSALGDKFNDLINEAKKEAVLLGDILHIIQPFLNEPTFEDEGVRHLMSQPDAKTVISAAADEVKKEKTFSNRSYASIMEKVKEKTGKEGKNLFMPIRAALTGRIKGLEIEKVFNLLGRDKVLDRLERWKSD